MASLFLSPQWFNIITTLLVLFSFLVSTLISALSHRAYRITKEKKFRNFSLAFLFITLAFIVQIITNLIVYVNIEKGYNIIAFIISNGFAAYAILTVIGFFLLAMLSLKIEDVKVGVLIGVLVLIALFISPSFTTAFHLILFALLCVISFCFYKNCCEKQSVSSKIVFVAFLLMTFSHVFHLAGKYIESVFIGGSIMQFAGYLLLLIAILRLK